MKKSLLLILMVPLLIGCVSKAPTGTIDGTAYMLLTTVPELPTPPTFPDKLNWGYQEPLYTLDEAGAQKILQFRDKNYLDFCYDLETWEMQFDAVKKRISELNL